MSSGELVIETTEGALAQLLEAMDEDAANGPETDLVNDDNDDDEDSDKGDNKDNEGETPDNDEKAHEVVNEKLRVRGTSSLRVIDAGIMPVIPNGNTYSTTCVVAMRGVDLICEDW